MSEGDRFLGKSIEELKALGEGKTKYSFTGPDASLLERFVKPAEDDAVKGVLKVDIIAPEFTSLCPKTGQPDFASIEISYIPDKWCIESKSLKLYLMGYRMHGAFHEDCVNRIGNDLVKLLEPHVLTIIGKFTPRGGIKFWPTFGYQRPQKITAPR